MIPNSAEYDRLALLFANICSKSGARIMEIYETDFAARAKTDTSPVTEADEAAEAIILEALQRDCPGIPVLAEESFATGLRPDTSGSFLLVDPVDGTKEFISRNGEFTVNIALIERTRPVAGCVYAPARQQMFFGARCAWTAQVEAGAPVATSQSAPIRTRAIPDEGPTAVMSRSHVDSATQAFAEQHGVSPDRRISAGSSLKFCLIASGKADIYPRFGPTMEWDTGAGHAVLNAAGGRVSTPEGDDFVYGKKGAGYRNGAFVAWGQN
jgi:3'(2'), 5'-bisphosphate nucleotidase